jgi:uncharacterized protein (DUF1697 family)
MREEAFVVLFRGVGGKIQLPTKPLRETLGEAGFGNVATYIASGNAVLTSDLRADDIGARVSALVRQKFGFEKAVMVVPLSAWSRLIARNPFPEAVKEPTTLHVFVLEAAPRRNRVEALLAKAAPGERVAVSGNVLYFHAPQGFGTSRLPPVIDRTLGTASTARNWNTVVKLEQLAREAAARLSPGSPKSAGDRPRPGIRRLNRSRSV